MTDTEDLLEFLERGVRMGFDMGLQFLRVELAPVSPAGFRGQGSRLSGRQIAVHRLPAQLKAAGGLGFGATAFNKLHHPLP